MQIGFSCYRIAKLDTFMKKRNVNVGFIRCGKKAMNKPVLSFAVHNNFEEGFRALPRGNPAFPL
jgi:hypothetical protein